jgi:hypothetical protein
MVAGSLARFIAKSRKFIISITKLMNRYVNPKLKNCELLSKFFSDYFPPGDLWITLFQTTVLIFRRLSRAPAGPIVDFQRLRWP